MRSANKVTKLNGRRMHVMHVGISNYFISMHRCVSSLWLKLLFFSPLSRLLLFSSFFCVSLAFAVEFTRIQCRRSFTRRLLCCISTRNVTTYLHSNVMHFSRLRWATTLIAFGRCVLFLFLLQNDNCTHTNTRTMDYIIPTIIILTFHIFF